MGMSRRFSRFHLSSHRLTALFIFVPLILSLTTCSFSQQNKHEEALRFFKDHKSDMDALVVWGESAEESPWGYSCHQPELPANFKRSFASETALVCEDNGNTVLVAVIPPNGYRYFTYMPSQQSPPITHIGGYSVNCSEKIDTDWFFCVIGIN